MPLKIRFYRFIAWLMPKQIVYWCCQRMLANATMGRWSDRVVSDVTVFEMMARWDIPNNTKPWFWGR